MSAWGPCDGNAVPDCQRPIDFLSEVCVRRTHTCARAHTHTHTHTHQLLKTRESGPVGQYRRSKGRLGLHTCCYRHAATDALDEDSVCVYLCVCVCTVA